jgi:diaminopimelate epimerase
VNYVEVVGNNQIKIRTYERGVENETLACGTGAIAAALATKFKNKANTPNFFEVEALGGNLRVSFDTSNNEKYTNVWLTGPATKVFEGKVEFND